jgi:hypothetical protein
LHSGLGHWSAFLLSSTFVLSAFGREPPVQRRASVTQQETAWTWLAEGDELFDAHNYDRALERYSAAYRLTRDPVSGMSVARTLAALNQWVEASATALELLELPTQAHEPHVFDRARDEAKELWRTLSARLPALTVHVTPPGVASRIELDGVHLPGLGGELPVPANPGKHRLTVVASGYLPHEREIELTAGARERLFITLAPLPPESDAQAARSAALTRGYVALGVAGVGLLVGGTAGVLAFTSRPHCPDSRCELNEKSAADASLRYGNVANVGIGVAIVAGGYGLWELLANVPKAESSASAPGLRTTLAVQPTQGTLHLSGKF